MVSKSIGVFDSGLGGISVLNRCIELLPHEDFIYFADKFHAPYGDKSTEDIILFMKEVMDNFFMKRDVKAVVVACNTATNAAVDILRKEYDIPIIGTEPAIKPALIRCNKTKTNNKGKTLVLATESTIKSKKFLNNLSKYDNDSCIKCGCSGLVELIESNNRTGIVKYLKDKFDTIDKNFVDSVVLGCTHYPFIKKEIVTALGKEVTFYDGGEGVARRLKNILNDKNIISTRKEKGVISVFSSSNEIYNDFLKSYIEV